MILQLVNSIFAAHKTVSSSKTKQRKFSFRSYLNLQVENLHLDIGILQHGPAIQVTSSPSKYLQKLSYYEKVEKVLCALSLVLLPVFRSCPVWGGFGSVALEPDPGLSNGSGSSQIPWPRVAPTLKPWLLETRPLWGTYRIFKIQGHDLIPYPTLCTNI